ncbi:MAG: diguanylate cyclase [Proteobacteria bacterium]|nr:diguanylate cyclase [Pseudomonadota bacterium]
MISQFTKAYLPRLFLGLLVIVFIGELGVGVFLDRIFDNFRPKWLSALLDAALLAAICVAFIRRLVPADVALPQRAGMDLEASEERYRALFDYGGDAIIFLKTMQKGLLLVVDANEVACKRLGYRHDELVGMSVASFNVSGYPVNAVDIACQLKQYGQALFETLHLTKDGRQIPVEVQARTFQFHGEAMTLAIARDITERRQAGQEKDELQRNMQALLNAIQESTFLLDTQGKILIINEVAAQRLNTTPLELTGKNIYDILPADVLRFRRAKFDQMLRRGMPETYEDERGGRRFSSTVYPVRNAAGEVAGFAVYAADVTQQRRLQGIEELFSEINQLVLQGVPLHTVLIVACNKVTELFRLAVAWVGRKEQDGAISVLAGGGVASRYVDSLKQTGLRWDDTGRGPAASAIRSGRAHVFKAADPRFDSWAKLALEHELQSILAIPLVIRGEIHGVFTLYSNSPDFFDVPSVVDMMTGVAMRISVAMETAMDQQQTRLLSSALAAAGNGVMITNAHGHIQWVNPAFVRLSGYSREELIGQTPRILKSGVQPPNYYQALWASIGKGEIWSSETTERARDGSLYTVSQTITPILNDEGEIAYYIAIHDDITAQKLSQERIEYMAHYDVLTGLPNRALFYDRLKQVFMMAKRTQGGLTLLFLDLDGFKQVNDSLGHHVGDLLLKAVAARLRECVRESDTVARLGGDEFTVILNDTHQKDSIVKVVEKIIQAIARPFDLEGVVARIGVSIGIACDTEETISEDELVNHADQAMYAAKSAGKNTWRFGSADV